MSNDQAVVLLVAIVSIAALLAWYYWDSLQSMWANRPAVPATSGGSLFNTSFVLAVVFGLALGYFLGVPLTRKVASMIGLRSTFLVHWVTAISVAAVYVAWVYHNTPTNHKTALLFFGTSRFRVGPGGFGFEEGLNAMPLGWPFFTPVDKDVSQFVEEFKQMKAYSQDKQPVKITGTFRRYIDDIYATFNVNNKSGTEEEAVQELVSLTLKQIRAAAEAFPAEDLVSQEANGGTSTKDLLATRAFDKVQTDLSGGNWFGYNIMPIQVNEIDLDPDFEKALKAKSREEKEGEAEKVQVKRRLEQIKDLTDQGINPDHAAAIAQVEAEKPGAKINTLNLPGSQGIGEGIGKFAEAASNWLNKK